MEAIGRAKSSGPADWVCRRGRAMAALLAAAILVSACATTGTQDAGPAGAAGPTKAARAEGDQPTPAKRDADLPPRARPGAGLLSPLATAGYFPLKILPCSLGTVGSLVGFLFSFDAQMVRDTVTLNCGGNWIITPGMLEGTEDFRSVGRIEDQPGPPALPFPPPTAGAPPIREPSLE